MSDIRITLMEHSDLGRAARVLSHAMLNNPLHLAVFQGNSETERLEIESMFLELLKTFPGIVFVARAGEKIVGVMRMTSCVGREVEKPSGAAPDRKTIWHREWGLRDPKDQHWHLGPIGVLAAYQGQGIGTRLMNRFCDEVDLCRAKAYLETDRDKNVRFYTNFGFQLIAESTILDAPSRYMLREAR